MSKLTLKNSALIHGLFMKKELFAKDIDYAILILRLAVGVFFMIAGLAQVLEINGFVNTVSGFAIVPIAAAEVTTIAQAVLPWIEIILGVLLFFGLGTALAGILVAFLSFVFAAANGFVEGASLVKEILFVAVGLALMLTGGGSMSVDAYIKKNNN